MRFLSKVFAIVVMLAPVVAQAAVVDVGLNRAELIRLNKPLNEVIIANPEIADIVVHGSKSVSIIGKRIGSTNLRFFDSNENLIKEYDVAVGYDLPAIRRALKKFFPDQDIAVETINNSLAVSGVVPDAQSANRVMQVAFEFVKESRRTGDDESDFTDSDNRFPGIVNLLSLNSGQQVMLKVRIGELERTALKQLGFNINGGGSGNNSTFSFGTFAGATAQTALQRNPATGALEDVADFILSAGRDSSSGGLFSAGITRGDFSASGLLDALERDGLFKSLAEPTLTAISGETASFLAGGEFPITTTNDDGVDVEFKEFGVSLTFTPFVLTQNRIRLTVAPEISSLDLENQFGGFPSLRSRRATTTVELAPGESFMIAGLIRDTIDTVVDEIPGAAEVPIIGALLRSTSYTREETEMVISVTPYIVDPVRGIDIRLPTDEYRSPSVMEMFFYGAIGSLSGNASTIGQTPVLEGPIGYMVE